MDLLPGFEKENGIWCQIHQCFQTELSFINDCMPVEPAPNFSWKCIWCPILVIYVYSDNKYIVRLYFAWNLISVYDRWPLISPSFQGAKFMNVTSCVAIQLIIKPSRWIFAQGIFVKYNSCPFLNTIKPTLINNLGVQVQQNAWILFKVL